MKNRFLIFLGFSAVGALIMLPQMLPHHMVPSWLRILAKVLVAADCAFLALLALAIGGFLAVVAYRSHKDRKTALAPSSDREGRTAVQVLEDEFNIVGRPNSKVPYSRMYDIVRRIHGDDNASRLTREQIEAEYERYDRAETAASEERCQTCDPKHVPATFLVQAWDDQWCIGEWTLCSPHAEAKVAGVRSTGAQAIAEPWGGVSR